MEHNWRIGNCTLERVDHFPGNPKCAALYNNMLAFGMGGKIVVMDANDGKMLYKKDEVVPYNNGCRSIAMHDNLIVSGCK